jgi:hypothetical protein
MVRLGQRFAESGQVFGRARHLVARTFLDDVLCAAVGGGEREIVLVDRVSRDEDDAFPLEQPRD